MTTQTEFPTKGGGFDANAATVPELRAELRARSIGSGVWISGANREQCLRALEAGTVTPQPTAAHAAHGDLAAMIAAAVAPYVAAPAAALDEERVIELIRGHAPQSPTIRLEINSAPAVEVSRQHFKFQLLVACINAGVPALLVGPAGTGKTTVARAAALAVGREFAAISFGPMTSKGDLFGVRDAAGVVHESDLVRLAKGGGVFLGDEMDAGNAGVLTMVNMLLANGHFATPTGMVEKSDAFIFIAGANTYGTGANRTYVGRNQLDAATLDRFAVIDWPLDVGLEAFACGINEPSLPFDLAAGGVPSPSEWLAIVRAFRAGVAKAGVRHEVTQRASILGCALIRGGVGVDHLKALLLNKGLDAATLAKIAAN